MLVLTRYPGQTVFIGENNEIAVTVLEVIGNNVRLGFTCDKKTPILREEVALRNQAEIERRVFHEDMDLEIGNRV